MAMIPLFTPEEAEKLTDKALPAPFVECQQFAELITHCKVCRLPRDDAPGGLNDSGYCESCWQHIAPKLRTAPNRGIESRRMHWLLIRTAKTLNQSLPYLRIVWIEERNAWLWRRRGIVTANGQVQEDTPCQCCGKLVPFGVSYCPACESRYTP